ncbi:MAG: IS21 family transposase [Acidimicrobiia bacterium]
MLSQEQAVEIRVLARRGSGVREIARQLGCSRNTVRRYLRDRGLGRYGPRAVRATKLDDYKEYLRRRVAQARPRWIPATVLLREIREHGYAGGISQLKAWLSGLKQVAPEAVVRFETAPGEQMQVDFTWVRRGRDPLVALVATLGYSRATFVRFGSRENADALIDGLRAALDYFGGVPSQVLFDNARTVVIDRDAYGPGRHRWHDRLRDLAEEFGFRPRLCRPYRAKTKGKVERFNGYLKGSFLVPLVASLNAGGLRLTADVANVYVGRWLDEVANARIHATTKAIPAVRLEEERAVMPAAPALLGGARRQLRMPVPVESLQHPLAVYDALLEVRP